MESLHKKSLIRFLLILSLGFSGTFSYTKKKNEDIRQVLDDVQRGQNTRRAIWLIRIAGAIGVCGLCIGVVWSFKKLMRPSSGHNRPSSVPQVRTKVFRISDGHCQYTCTQETALVVVADMRSRMGGEELLFSDNEGEPYVLATKEAIAQRVTS